MTDADRRRTALHEAGHGIAQVVLGRSVEYVSIRPGKTFSGVAVPIPHERLDIEGFNPFLPVAQEPAALRADIERDIIIDLAGDLATLLDGPGDNAPPASSYRDEPDVDAIARRALEQLGPRLAELVVEHEQSEDPIDTDDAKAWTLAKAFAGPEASFWYLEWLRAETRELVIRNRVAILRVADALERHAVLRGEQVAALVYPPKQGDPNAST
jgi:hypothetical protein